MSWDPKAERITAQANAEEARAKAEAIREQTRLAAELADDDRQERRRQAAEQRRQERRVQHAERRAELARKIRGNGGQVIPLVAVGSPAVIAWRGQYEFAREVMDLGRLSVLLPVAVEGSVLYMAFLAHQAIKATVSPARYRAMTWLLAAVAAGLNCWHGLTQAGHSLHELSSSDLQVGISLGLTSLLGIGLLELTTAFRSIKSRVESGRSAEDIRRALVRRFRYPRLSVSAVALAASRGITPEEAWRAAWIERYGLGPEASRRERLVARQVLKRERKAACTAADRGALTIVDGQLVPAAWFGEPADGERNGPDGVDSGPADQATQERQGERLDTSAMDTVVDTTVAMEVPEGIAAIERWLSAPAHERHTERLGERPVSGHDERPDERNSERPDERLGERAPERSGERLDEREGERPGERVKGRSRKRRSKARGKSQASGGHADRLATVRRLLAERPEMSGAQIEAETGIPESTARRLAARIRREQSGGGER